MKQYSPHDNVVVLFGILGNIVSFLVFLSPVPTFYRIYKKKSIEEFQSVPYFVAFFSSTLYLYYGYLKKDSYIISINSFGVLIESIYLIMYFKYSPSEIKAFTVKIFLMINIGLFGSILLLTLLELKDQRRVSLVGTCCAILSVSVFIAPLSIVRRVIRTKSVEYMPFLLSFFLTVCAVMWFCYGFLLKDYYIAGPNILGFMFGMTQMILYGIYKNYKKPQSILPEILLQDMTGDLPINEVEVRENASNGNDPQMEVENAKSDEMDYDAQMDVEIAKPEEMDNDGIVEVTV